MHVQLFVPGRLAALAVSFSLAFTVADAQGSRVAASQRSTVPSSLTNQQFNEIFTTFSESGGSFSSDNFTSNETTIGQVARRLIDRGITGGAYVGVGPEQNFTYIAALKPDIVFLVDIRRQAVMQHLMYKAIFEMSGNRSEFIATLFSMPVQSSLPLDATIDELWTAYAGAVSDSTHFNRNFRAILTHLRDTRGILLSLDDTISMRYVFGSFWRYGPAISYRPTSSSPTNFMTLTSTEDTTGVKRSFLANEANYSVVRNLHTRNLIIPVVGDFGGTQALRMVGDYLREHNAVLSAFYTSNVEQYLFRPTDSWRQYYRNVGSMLLDSLSLFIRPVIGSGGQGFVVLQGRNGATIQIRPPLSPALTQRPTQTRAVPQDPALGSFAGTVTDTAGRALGNTAVSVVGTSHGAVSGVDGRFTIPNVPPGSYSVTARRVGTASVTLANIVATAGVATPVDFRLRIATLVLSGVISTNMSSASRTATVELCPVLPFLAAHAAGRIVTYADVVTCVRQ